MDDRIKTVLRTLIRNFIDSAEPVGSRTLSRLLDIDLSPATIRNIMADLTEYGFLEQPYPSAGRIPTEKSYRFFLDTCELDMELSEKTREGIEQRLMKKKGGLNHMLEEATRIISNETTFTGLVSSPRLSEARMRRVDFLRIDESRVYVVLITISNMIHNRIIEVSEELSQDFLDQVSGVLNEQFSGSLLSEVRSRMVESLMKDKDAYEEMLAQAVRVGKKALDLTEERELYVDGHFHMVEGFSGMDSIRKLLMALEEKMTIIELLDQTLTTPGLRVRISPSLANMALQECSVVASTYGGKDRALGTIGIMGPLRMDYQRVIPVVDYTARMLTEMICNQ